MYNIFQELASLKEGSSGEVEELRAQLASTKEILEADIKGKEQVCSTLTIFIAGGFNVKELANFFIL